MTTYKLDGWSKAEIFIPNSRIQALYCAAAECDSRKELSGYCNAENQCFTEGKVKLFGQRGTGRSKHPRAVRGSENSQGQEACAISNPNQQPISKTDTHNLLGLYIFLR